MSTKQVECIQHTENLFQYRILEHLDRVSYYTSAYAFIKDKRAILIDAGYLEMGKHIYKDFKKRGITVDKIIISHCHKDHLLGVLAFDDPFIILGDGYENNLNRCRSISHKTQSLPEPQMIVHDTCSFLFRESKFFIFKTPGHAPCGLSVIIDDEYLFVGDLILEDIDHKIIIPYIDKDADPEAHLKSLRSLQRFESHHLMLSHGQAKFNISIDEHLSHQIYYLERFIETGYEGNLDICLMSDKENYAMLAIHKINRRNALKKLKYQVNNH